MSRFSSHYNRPDHLLASIVALSEQTNRLAMDSALDATRADSHDRVSLVVDRVCRLAVGAGVSAGELAWLAGELEAAEPSDEQLAEAAVAVAATQSCMSSVAFAVSDVAERRGAIEVRSSAEALSRVATELERLQLRLQPCDA